MPALSRLDVRVVHVVRDPYAVARSLVGRHMSARYDVRLTAGDDGVG
jgi:hypothetical protein